MEVKQYVDKSVVKHLYEKIKEDEATSLAAQLAFYFLLSIFPLFIFLITLLPFLPVSQNDIMQILHVYAPEEAVDLLQTNLKQIMQNRSGGLLSFGILAAIWSASNGMNAILRALNHAYDVEDKRNFFVTRGLSLLLTIGMIVVVLISLLLPVFGEEIGNIVFNFIGIEVPYIFDIFRWGTSITVIAFVFTCIYWLGPSVRMKWTKAIPGAVFAALGWSLASLAFSFYVGNFANYSSTYGNLGGIIVMMLWFYMTGLFIILGGEVNAVLAKKNKV